MANATPEISPLSEAAGLAANGARRRRVRRALKWIVIVACAIWLFDTAASLVITHTRLHRRLTARLAAAFGRPVEVGRFDFSLWTGPALEADSVVVADDPRFGHEYFLHAESLTIRFRWQSLLRGRLELGTLSLSHPSLNLVRNPDGDWNLYEWLPKPTPSAFAGATDSSGAVSQPPHAIGPVRANSPVLRFRKIEIDGGRINFKEGDAKQPVAFVNVKGGFETESPGRWRMDFDATPMRAATAVQQPGVLHLIGHVGGTSSRLRPASLELSWRDASITDVLSLVRSYDYGVHGSMALYLAAETEGDAWKLHGRTELRQIHRWDLPMRADNPGLNVVAEARLNPLASRLDLSRVMLETPHSSIEAFGRIDWSGADQVSRVGSGRAETVASHPRNASGETSRGEAGGSRLAVSSAGLDLNEALAWLRAFHVGVAEDLALHGWARMDATLRGWPPHPDDASLAVREASLTGKELRAPLHVGPAEIRYDAAGLRLSASGIAFGAAESALRLDASFEAPIDAARLSGGVPGAAQWRVSGGVDQVRDAFALAKSLGWDISSGWDFGGPLRCDLRWQSARFPWQSEPAGTLAWGTESEGGTLRAAFLNQPVEGVRARADFRPGGRHVTLASALALGAHWMGTFERSTAAPEWQFTLAADHLASADLDLWLNPRWRQTFLDRMLPFLNPAAPSASAAGGAGATIAPQDSLRAAGRLSVGEFTLATFRARQLQTDLSIEGRRLDFTNLTAIAYGGSIGGSLDAGLVSPPAYNVALQFTNLDLAGLTAGSPNLANLFSGSASGEISIHARGASRAELGSSLQCSGTARVSGAQYRGLALAESVRDGLRHPGNSSFRDGAGAFSCANNLIELRDWKLSGAAADLEAAGTVNYATALNLRVRSAAPGPSASREPKITAAANTPAAASGSAATSRAIQLTGTLASPRAATVAPAPR